LVLLEAENAGEEITNRADAVDIETNGLSEMFGVKIMAFRIEKALDPEIKVFLKQIQLEPVPKQAGGIDKVVVKDDKAQGWRKVVPKIARQLKHFVSVIRRACPPERESQNLR
jgi:hypothetical protein